MKFAAGKTKREAPLLVLVHGDGGIGKSTFAAGAPNPIFLTSEDGLSNIDATAVAPAPSAWADVLEAVDWVASSDFGTLAIDSLDWLEPVAWAHVCRAGGKKSIEDFGYGKGYVAALDEWRALLAKLTRVRDAGKNVVLIAHSARRPFKNPEGDDYDRWAIKLHEKASGLIREWVDIVAFASLDTATVEDENGRVKATSNGKRIIRCNPSATYDAKTRFDLPRALPLQWAALEQTIRKERKQ